MLSVAFERELVMKKSDITYIVSSVFAAMTAFFYCCIRWFSIKLPRYYPLEHTWKLVKEPSVPSQQWYTMQVFAFFAAGIVALGVYFIIKSAIFNNTQLKPALAKWLGIIATVIIIVCMGYIAYYEFSKWGVLKPLL